MNDIEIVLCVGLLGVFVISLTGDEFDAVYTDIADNGAERWYNDKIEWQASCFEYIYRIIVDIEEVENNELKYTVKDCMQMAVAK